MNCVGLVLLTLLTLARPGVLWAQAPASADLWRLAATSLPEPAALATGVTATFWNPSAGGDRRLAAGLQLIETPDIIGVSGLLAGVSYAVSHTTRFVVMVGRTDVSGLVRTTTSATSDQGGIPVYEQHVAAGAVLRFGAVRVGALARTHDARFDADQTNGFTADLGVRWTPLSRLTLAAASHFFPANLKGRETTDYYGGLEYQLRSFRIREMPSRVLARYGVSHREGNGVEHAAGLGLAMADWLRAEALITRELGYGVAEWRPSVGIGLRVGRYAITAARASGLNGLGATYRIGLDVDLIQ